jgi:hypothetical protein
MPMLPGPGSVVLSYQLNGVAALSAASAWAVGTTDSTDPRVVHWNGRTWTIVPSPVPPGANTDLLGMAAVSAGSAWAVGYTWPTGGPRSP